MKYTVFIMLILCNTFYDRRATAFLFVMRFHEHSFSVSVNYLNKCHEKHPAETDVKTKCLK